MIKLSKLKNSKYIKNKGHAESVYWFNQSVNESLQIDLALDNLILTYGIDSVNAMFKLKLKTKKAA